MSGPTTPVTAALAEATARLQAAGVASPRVDAELLLAHCIGAPRSRLRTLDCLAAADEAVFGDLVARRAAREPLQHIVGHAPFRHLEVAVGPGVFVPRPETELLVDAVLDGLRATAEPVVVDLCAGSGAIALSIAQELPGSRVYAVEKDDTALTWLRRNAEGTTVTTVAADVTDPALLANLRGSVDAAVSNPPYVPAGTAVEPEVHADPAVAVFAAADGMAVIVAVVARAAELLKAGGLLVIEHDDTQGEAVPALLDGDGHWREVADRDDLTGRPRYVLARRREIDSD